MNSTFTSPVLDKVRADTIEECLRVVYDESLSFGLSGECMWRCVRAKLRQVTFTPSERVALTQAALMELHERQGGKPTRPTVNETKVGMEPKHDINFAQRFNDEHKIKH